MSVSERVRRFVEDAGEYVISAEDERVIRYEGIETFIFNKLNSSKYRASATDSVYRQKVAEKIKLCVDHRIPIHISLPFGAAKNPYLPTSPGIDWAEVFNIAYIRDYLKPVAKAYRHGVVLEYISVAVFEETVNRIPKKDTDKYDMQFESLLRFYRRHLPENLELKYSRVEDGIPRKEIERLIGIRREELRRSWASQPAQVREQKLMRARRNCIFDPADKHADEIILNAALGHDAFCSECWTADLAPWDRKYMITLGHNYTKGWAIHVRSAPGSSVNFWSGTGVVDDSSGKETLTVLSLRQFGQVGGHIRREPSPVAAVVSPNLKMIPVIPRE